MTTVIKKLELEPLQKKYQESEHPYILTNGKLKQIDFRKDTTHFFRFLEITSNLLWKDIPSEVFTEAFLHYQRLFELMIESHLNDKYFNNEDLLAYFLALLDHHVTLQGKEIQEKTLQRILRFWGFDEKYDLFYRKISYAKQILEKSELLKHNSDTVHTELFSKVEQLISYFREKVSEDNYFLDLIRDDVLRLVEKKIIPFASLRDAALTMIVAFFPQHIKVPAMKLYLLLNARADFHIDLTMLQKRVKRYQSKIGTK